MKKLRINENTVDINTERAICNWCSEEKECFEAAVPISVLYRHYTTKLKRVIDDWRYSFWGNKTIVDGHPHLERVVIKEEDETVERSAHICSDCAKQLAKHKLGASK